ncbi:SMC family ATPase [Ruicaihuangia caeni]|uniref:Nuclease SbcCD subunit C n=1 Tax=Ruicaihuangia caeni TaxID=3042517 RepID=A0AAW6TBL4_9MICO|nr:SMC family ATPase [Klugiella sp. YN-L-19]MDI2099688.1 SMC family ATPase [Klugiella sp. YN-L-19]
MKIERLRLAGFGPYKTEQVVDFSHFADDGIFLISGKTGAGKSSLLDAICFALYDGVPRYEGTKPRLRSDHCAADDHTIVELEFTIHGDRYRVTRSPEYERPRKRGGGTTTQAATATLEQLRDGVWTGIAAKPRDVGIRLSELIGLSREQFLQVILLAQNRFQEFLLAKSSDRLALLRTLFGTRRFQQLEAELQSLRAAAKAAVDESESSVEHRREELAALLERAGWVEERSADAGSGATCEDADSGPAEVLEASVARVQAPEADGERADGETADGETVDLEAADVATLWFTMAIEWFEERAAEAAAALARHSVAVEEAERHRDAELTLAERQLRRAAAESALLKLEALADRTDESRALVERAERAAGVWPTLIAHADAASGWAAAGDGAAEALRGLGDVVEELLRALQRPEAAATAAAVLSGDHDALAPFLDLIIADKGALESAAADERRLPELAEAAAAAELRRELLDQELEQLEERARSLPARIDVIRHQLHAHQLLAAEIDNALADLERLGETREAARAVQRLEPELASAVEQELSASRRHGEAAQRLTALREARYRGYAAELAAQLESGAPCVVCGSNEHPAPAAPSDDAVSQHDIDQATEQLDRERAALDETAVVVHASREALAAARARLGRFLDLADPLASVDEAIASAEQRAKASRLAAQMVTTQSTALDSLLNELAQAQERAADAREHRTAAVAAEEAALRSHDDMAAAIESRRGDHASIAERMHALVSGADAVKRVRDAAATLAERKTVLDRAARALQEGLQAHGFAEADEVREARLEPSELEKTRARIKAHDDEVVRHRATLDDPQLRDLPTEPADPARAESSLAVARAARDGAVAAQSARAEQLTQARRLTDEALEALERTRVARERYEGILQLANTVKGDEPNTRKMSLEAYVLAAELEAIVDAANSRLRVMTDARYSLVHDDEVQYRRAASGLGLAILDQHTGVARATHSLSGGETFLASLALALGLAEVVTSRAGGITLDTLFIDEGFGSLDAATLETAMSTLHGLRAGGRTIGLISHVEAMREQIPATLRINVTPHGWSVLDQPDAVPPVYDPGATGRHSATGRPSGEPPGQPEADAA